MIVFCGYANTDVVARVRHLPGGGERVHATTIEYHHGGMAANAAVAAARLGAETRFAGAVGSGDRDRVFLDALADSGVDTSWCDTSATLPTCVILVTPDGERSVISHDDALSPDHLAHAAHRLRDHGGGWLYVDGYRWPAAGAAIGAALPDPRAPDSPAAAADVRILVDLDGCTDRAAAETALSHAHHVVVGQTLLSDLFGVTVDPAALAARFTTTLLVTAGAAGWTLAEPNERVVHGDAYPVAVADTTGAGDSFAGAYLAHLDRGDSPVQAARIAAVAAALACTVAGARGAPDSPALRAASRTAITESKENLP